MHTHAHAHTHTHSRFRDGDRPAIPYEITHDDPVGAGVASRDSSAAAFSYASMNAARSGIASTSASWISRLRIVARNRICFSNAGGMFCKKNKIARHRVEGTTRRSGGYTESLTKTRVTAVTAPATPMLREPHQRRVRRPLINARTLPTRPTQAWSHTTGCIRDDSGTGKPNGGAAAR